MKKIIIVGGGMAGLSAGCYLQMNGYDTEIYEMGAKPGGLCTAWQRKDYLIDGCIHWFVGGNPKSGSYAIWSELMDMKTLTVNTYGEFCSLEDDGKTIRFYSDLDKLKRELEEMSPEDSKVIGEMTSAARKLALFDNFFAGTTGGKIKLLVGILPLIAKYKKWMEPAEKFAEKFKHPLIRKMFALSFGDAPMLFLLLTAGSFHNRNAGYPVGGAREVASRIASRYESLGGRIHYNSKVTKIIVEDSAAKGIMLESGEKHAADIVISAADGRYTVFNMLEGKYLDEKIKKVYLDKKNEPKKSGLYVALGVARKFSESYKPYAIFTLEKPLVVDNNEIWHLGVTIHNFDPKAAPEGKTVLTASVESNDPQYWVKLRETDRAQYDRKKNEIAQRVIEELDRHLGDIKDKLEMVDVATPATFIRYTNNWNGAPMAWQNFKLFLFKPHKRIKGLNNFYMCGHWTGEPGLPGAAMSGRQAAQMVCRQDGKPFKTSRAGES